MTTETEANPVAEESVTPDVQEADTPELEAETTEEDTEDPTDEEIDDLLAEPEAGEDFVEIEIDGKTIKVSPEGKDYLLRQQDYTKKTMELAEQRKAFEARQKEIEGLSALSQERQKVIQSQAQIKARIEAIEKIPVDGLEQDQINGFQIELINLQNQLTQWDNYGKQVAQREDQERGQQFAKAVEAARSEAAKRVPNFDTRRTDLEAFAIATGASPDDVNNIADPAVWELLHYADIGKKALEARKKAKTIKDASQTETAPEVGGKKASAGKDPSKMSPEEYHKMRLKQRGTI